MFRDYSDWPVLNVAFTVVFWLGVLVVALELVMWTSP